MIADPTDLLNEIARPPSATVSPFDDREQVAEQLRDFHLDVLPVLDIHGRLIGAIRHDALLKTLEEAASVDIQMMVGAGREERALSAPQFAVRKRLPWLQINLATAFLAASVVGLFEDTIAKFTALAVLLPVVAGQSGNAGAQALAVTMRGLALREISTRHWFRVLFKEMYVGSQRPRDRAHDGARRAGLERQHGARARDLHRDGVVDGDRRHRGLGDSDRAHAARPGSRAVLDDHPDDGHRRRGLHVVPGHRDAALEAAVAVHRETGAAC